MIRLALFAAVLTVLLLVGIEGWLSAIIAAVVGLCVSYLFLGRLRTQVASGVEDRRTGKTHAPTDDEDAEDTLEDNDYLKGDRPAQD